MDSETKVVTTLVVTLRNHRQLLLGNIVPAPRNPRGWGTILYTVSFRWGSGRKEAIGEIKKI